MFIDFKYVTIRLRICIAEIIIDEDVRHGKPSIKGTKITVDEVLGMLESSMTSKEIEEEYGLTEDKIRVFIMNLGS
ncbi:MAG: DUF433 domain-containing protein [Candidatus Thermoplasmatota archaeon]